MRAEDLPKNISYSEYLKEHLDPNIDYSEYGCDDSCGCGKGIKYSDYIAIPHYERIDKIIENCERENWL